MTRKVQFATFATVVLTAALVFTTQAGAATPTLTATPSTNLVDGQVVHVEVTGLTPNSPAGVALCLGGHGYEGCDPNDVQLTSTDANGHFVMDYAVQTILHTALGTFDCRDAANNCGLAANTTYTTEGAALLGVTFDPNGPLLPPPSIDVSPSTGLVDRQGVHVTGSGFRPLRSVLVAECIGGTSDLAKCRQNYYAPVTVAADGTVDTTLGVRTILVTSDGTSLDCRSAAGACEVQVGPFDPSTDRVSQPLAFDPNAPLAPPPTVTVTPSTGLVDGQHVVVDGAGFSPSTPVGVSECANTSSVGTCALGTSIQTAGDGTFSLQMDLHNRMWAGTVLDCRDPAVSCSIQAYSFFEPDGEATAALSFDPNGPNLPPPVLTPSPSTGLVDGQTIAVTGSGFAFPFGPIFLADRSVRPATARWVPPVDPRSTTADVSPPVYPTSVQECLVGADPLSPAPACSQFYGFATLDGDGNLDGQVQVWAQFSTRTGEVIDCRTAPQGCELRTGYGDPYSTATAPITFDPDAPLAPPPTVTVTPTTGLTDGSLLHVVGDGFGAYATIVFHQCLSSGTGLTGCDTDLTGIASSDANGHIDAVTGAKRVIGLGTGGDPYSTTFDCASSPGACRLLLQDPFGPDRWPQVTLDYAGSATPPPTPAAPAAPAAPVAVEAAFTG